MAKKELTVQLPVETTVNNVVKIEFETQPNKILQDRLAIYVSDMLDKNICWFRLVDDNGVIYDYRKFPGDHNYTIKTVLKKTNNTAKTLEK